MHGGEEFCTPLHPIAEWGRQRFGGADLPAERRLTDLEDTLALVKIDPAENAPLLAPLLDIPLSSERAPALAAAELRRRQLAALSNLVMAGARTQPVVLTLEDAQWADPTTLDFVRGIVERPCFFSLLHDPSSGRLGQFAYITPRSLLPRLIDYRFGKWWGSYPPAMPCRTKSLIA